MMRPVQKEVTPSLRGTAGNHGRRPMRALTTNRLTVPSSELSQAAEVSHGLILATLATLATVGHTRAARHAVTQRR